MVVGATIAELVTVDLVDSLKEIVGAPDYKRKLNVYRMGGNVLDKPQYPCAILLDQGRDESDDGPNGLVQVNHRFDVIVGMEAVSSTWPETINAILADVAAKLREDHTRGGSAMDTHVESAEVWDSQSEGDELLGAGQVSVLVHYRHLYDDPKTSR